MNRGWLAASVFTAILLIGINCLGLVSRSNGREEASAPPGVGAAITAIVDGTVYPMDSRRVSKAQLMPWKIMISRNKYDDPRGCDLSAGILHH